MNTKVIGNIAEDNVVKYLLDNGYSILDRNYRILDAEIDIVACKDNTINFIEVKKIPYYWDGLDISAKIGKQKMLKIKKAASVYLAQCTKKNYYEISFDVAIVVNSTITLYNGAF